MFLCNVDVFNEGFRYGPLFPCAGPTPSADGTGEVAGRAWIQWSVRVIPRPTSRLGMWHPTHPLRGETGQAVFEAPWWQDRQARSYDAGSAEGRAWGSWQVEQDIAPPLRV